MCDFMKILKFLITFNNFYIDFQWTASPSCREANQRASSEQPKQPIANRNTKFVTSVRPGEFTADFNLTKMLIINLSSMVVKK